ncbi:MAG: amino acid adenylation domain-containing protein, partial [Methylovulum sp.]|nr:amino acid adenylation domain-containing protein [Methylovulum sp.]
DELPLTTSGKLNRKALPQPELAAHHAYTAPRNAVEQTLAAIWQDVLRVQGVGIHDNYFGLGGDSILSIQIISRAKQAGLLFSLKQLFEAQTIAVLAAQTLAAASANAEQGIVSGSCVATPIQRYFFTNVTVDAHHFNQSVLLEVAADLDGTALAQAVGALLQHHDALRMRYSMDNGKAGLYIAADVGVAEVLQTGAYGSAEDLTAQAQLIQSSFRPDNGTLVRVVHFLSRDQGSGRLLLVIHHLAVDGVSWRILLADLHQAYLAAVQGKRIDLPQKTTSYIQWAEKLQSWAKASPDAVYWTTQAAVPVAVLPLDNPADGLAVTLADTVIGHWQLDSQLTRQLMQAPRWLQASVEEVLLAALVETLWEWLGKQTLSIELEGHGREDVFKELDVSRTVGWFTTLFPLAVTATADTALDAVKSALRALPNRGLGYGVLRYLSSDDSLQQQLSGAATTGLRFNYLGRFSRADGDGVFIGQALENRGDERAPGQCFDVLMDINSAVHDDCLQLDWRYSPLQFHPDTVKRLLDGFAQNLGRLLTADVDVLAHADDIEAVYPLSPLQQGLLFHSVYAQASASYLQQVSWQFNGRLHVGAWRDAWRQLIQQHPVLRTGFAWQGAGQPLQQVFKQVELPWRETDLSGLDKTAQQQAVHDCLHDDRLEAFDTAQAPLMRCLLLRLSADRHVFLWTYHHVLFDGWSLPKLLEDLFALYAAQLGGQPPQLPQRLPFKTYIDWLAEQDAGALKNYWTAQLAGFTSPNHLAIDLGGELHSAARYHGLDLSLDEGLTADIEAYARARRVTLNTVLQGAWAVLLSRYCNSRDIVFGVTVSGRPADMDGVADSVGLYINTVPVRVRLHAGLGLTPFLQQLFKDNMQRLEFAHAQLAEVQRWSQIDGGQGLFDTLFIFENYPIAETLGRESAELKLEDFRVVEQTDLPLTVLVTPGSQLLLTIFYQQHRFAPAAIDALLKHYRQILVAMLQASCDRLAELSLLDEAGCAQLMVANEQAMHTDYALHADSLPQLLARQVRLTPERIAVQFGAQTLTFAELELQANGLAQYLVAQGAAPEKTIAVCVERCPNMLVALLAVLKTGAAYLPLDPQLPAKRLQHMVGDSGAMLVLVNGPSALELSVDVADMTRCRSVSDESPDVRLHPDNLAYIIYTSGSTGTPKGVQVSHRNIVNFLQTTAQRPGLNAEDRLLAVTTPAFDIAALELYLPLCTGARVVIADSLQSADGYALQALLQQQGITVMQATPATWRLLLAAGWRGTPTFKALCGGEALSAKLAGQLHASAGQVWNLYGPTETTVWSMRWRLDGTATVLLGEAMGNTRLYIVDDAMQLLPPGLPGELMIAGLGVARGYRNRAGLTAERFIPDPFSGAGERMYRTGDLVKRHSNGEIEYLGRLDFQAKIRGYRIELGEIETVLEQHPAIRQAVAVVGGAGDGDATLYAYYCGDNIEDAVLRAWCADTLPAYMIPADFIHMAAFALTHSGKIDRKALPKPERRIRQHSGKPLQSAAEQLLGGIWREVLQRDDIGRDDNFFDIGGHSLLLMQVWNLLQQQTQGGLQTVDLFRYPTIAKLAARLEQCSDGQATDGSAAVVKQAGQRARQQQKHRLGRTRR